MNYTINFVALGATVAIALLLPTEARANPLTPLEDTDGQPSELMRVEPLPAIVPAVVPEVVLEAGGAAGMAELPSKDLDLIPAAESANDPVQGAGAADIDLTSHGPYLSVLFRF